MQKKKKKKVTPKQVVHLLAEVSVIFTDIVTLNSTEVKKEKHRTRKIKICLCLQDLLAFPLQKTPGYESHTAGPPSPSSWSLLCFPGKGELLFKFLSICRRGKESHAKITSELSQWWSFFYKKQMFSLELLPSELFPCCSWRPVVCKCKYLGGRNRGRGIVSIFASV